MSVPLLLASVELLDRHAIGHMLTGSWASNEWGELRSTQDIDLVIDPTPASLDGFLDDVVERGWYVDPIFARAEMARRGMFNVIDNASGWKVDLIIIKDRPFSTSEFERRIVSNAFGRPVHLATAEDSIISKLEWAQRGGSDRQVGDVAAVLRLRGDFLDRDYIIEWTTELGLATLLARAQALADAGG